MDFYLAIVIIVSFSLLYYGYINKRRYQLKEKEVELRIKQVDLEMKKLEHGCSSQEKVRLQNHQENEKKRN